MTAETTTDPTATEVAATVPARLTARAAERPGDVALELDGGGRLTLGGWDRRSNAAARGLIAAGVRPGDRVVLSCDNRTLLDHAVAYVAVQKAGGVAVPVQRRMGEQHLRQVVRTTGAAGVVAEEAGPPGAAPPGWTSSVARLEAGRSDLALAPRLGAHDDAEILFTSGTTGTPKGVVATHENVLFTHRARHADQDVHVVLHALPPASLAGQGLLLQPLDGVPHRVVTLPEYDDESFVDAVHRHRPTHVVLVPALALSLIHSRAAARLDAGSVKAVRTISAPIPPAALERLVALFAGAAVFNLYTSTEAFPARVRIRFDPARPGSVGRADRSGAVRIVGDDGTPVPPATPGNVELRSPHAPQRRYLDDPAATAAVFRRDGWVRTGDVGRLDEDGYLHLLDRNQDLVNSGGLNISTIEVEAVMHEIPGSARPRRSACRTPRSASTSPPPSCPATGSTATSSSSSWAGGSGPRRRRSGSSPWTRSRATSWARCSNAACGTRPSGAGTRSPPRAGPAQAGSGSRSGASGRRSWARARSTRPPTSWRWAGRRSRRWRWWPGSAPSWAARCASATCSRRRASGSSRPAPRRHRPPRPTTGGSNA
ncbi:hypothetical protein BJF78_02300 [Pseudonocardia sp. CNS-139]|nr:hypothetical protein BJF78_02300 [Pseudonocardia sp. CNS-139]